MADVDVAGCLCYDASSSYAPSLFNNAVASCYSYFSTANQTEASILSSLDLGLCTKFAGPGVSASATPSRTIGPGSSPSSTSSVS